MRGPKSGELCFQMNKLCLLKWWCKQHIQIKLTMIIQNRIKEKIQKVGEKAKEKA